MKTPSLDDLVREITLLKKNQIAEGVKVSTFPELQAAVDSPAEIVLVQPGIYIGTLLLKNKPTKTLIKGISFEGRARPEYSYPVLAPPNAFVPVVRTEYGAHDYTFSGLEFTGVGFDRNVIEVGARKETSLDQLPYNIIFDQNYIHGVNQLGHRGIYFDCINGVAIDNYVSEFVEVGRDSQCIGVVNGAGPYLFDNNYFSASGEGIIFGGADPTIPNLIPSDITISNNHFFKPLSWKLFLRSVKNAAELKNAQRVKIFNNVFENVWADAQAGSSVVFTVRNQNNTAPWCNVKDVEFFNNIIRNASNAGINIQATDSPNISGVLEDLHIHHNLFQDCGTGIQILLGGKNYNIHDNVMIGIKARFLAMSGLPAAGFKFTNNRLVPGEYGISGDSTGVGTPTLEKFAPGYIFTGNVIEANIIRNAPYPPGNTIGQPIGTVKETDWKAS